MEQTEPKITVVLSAEFWSALNKLSEPSVRASRPELMNMAAEWESHKRQPQYSFYWLKEESPALWMSKKLAWLQVALYLRLLREGAKYLIKSCSVYDQADICEASGGLYEAKCDGWGWKTGQKVLLCSDPSCRVAFKTPQSYSWFTLGELLYHLSPAILKRSLILLAFRWACTGDIAQGHNIKATPNSLTLCKALTNTSIKTW